MQTQAQEIVVPGLREGAQVICHDNENVISAKIAKITESGCELISLTQSSTPAFGHKAHLLMSLADETTGKSMNLKVRLTAAARRDGMWVYRIRFK